MIASCYFSDVWQTSCVVRSSKAPVRPHLSTCHRRSCGMPCRSHPQSSHIVSSLPSTGCIGEGHLHFMTIYEKYIDILYNTIQYNNMSFVSNVTYTHVSRSRTHIAATPTAQEPLNPVLAAAKSSRSPADNLHGGGILGSFTCRIKMRTSKDRWQF